MKVLKKDLNRKVYLIFLIAGGNFALSPTLMFLFGGFGIPNGFGYAMASVILISILVRFLVGFYFSVSGL
ncbi:MAG: hypothetical protein ACFFAU_18610 [Candidatus Hodarchaeota archaeon]